MRLGVIGFEIRVEEVGLAALDDERVSVPQTCIEGLLKDLDYD